MVSNKHNRWDKKENVMIYRRFAMIILLALLAITAQPGKAAPVREFSIASGDVDQESIILWAHGAEVGAEVAFTVTKGGIQDQQGMTASATVSDEWQPVKVEIKGLQAGTRYRYTVTDKKTNTQKEGTFKTPAAAGSRTGLRFGVSGDWRQGLLPLPAIRNLASRNLDFFVAEGDTIYADYPSPDVTVKNATTLMEYRLKHNENLTTRGGLNTWPEARASTAFFATIDDHEVINDFAGGAPVASDMRFDRNGTLLNDTNMYKFGLQAFTEYYPIRDVRYKDADARYDGKPDLYRYRTFGDDAALFVLDSRSFRDENLKGVPFNQVTDKPQIEQFNKAAFDPARTLLGKPQLARLKEDLLKAQKAGITWKFVLNPEPIQNLGVLNAQDRWEGFLAERTDVLKFITDNKIDNVVFVSADFHGTFVNNLFYQTEAGGANTAANNSWEIITGSVAFDAPFGPTVIQLAADAGLLKPEQQALYNFAPIPQKDGAVKTLLNTQIKFYGYDPIGLDDSGIDFTLLKGDWVVTHSYGWTEFEIEGSSRNLLVTTYGVPWYTTKQAAEPEKIAALQPTVYAQFSVRAK
jgi:alkaline phosphatase D